MSTVVAIFSGTTGPGVVHGAASPYTIPGVLVGDKITQVIGMADGQDYTDDFAPLAPANGVLVQLSTASLDSLHLLAMLSRE